MFERWEISQKNALLRHLISFLWIGCKIYYLGLILYSHHYNWANFIYFNLFQGIYVSIATSTKENGENDGVLYVITHLNVTEMRLVVFVNWTFYYDIVNYGEQW